jgi:23S rRNA pseudouridine2605 synthase
LSHQSSESTELGDRTHSYPAQQGRANLEQGKPERLQKILAQAGLGSRRGCEELVLQGRVTVDGQVVDQLGTRVDPSQAKIAVDGEPIHLEPLIYFAVNKPKGYVSTNFDPAGRPRVVDLLPEVPERVYTVGRLDEDSTGLMILTNDGELANRLAHPRFGVEKTYRALVAGLPRPETLAKLTEGIWLAEGKVRVQRVRVVGHQGHATLLELVLTEGKKREIRRMLAKLGHKVMSLNRVAVGPITLKGLAVGESRPLSRQETDLLRQVAAIIAESTARFVDSEPLHHSQQRGGAMLVLSRKRNESIIINDNITVAVIEIRGDKVRLGIEAPKDVTVHRREVYEAVQNQARMSDQGAKIGHPEGLQPAPDQNARIGQTQRGDGFQSGTLILVPTVEASKALDQPPRRADVIDPEHTRAHNNLLYWLSAAGTGQWDPFLRTCQVLGLAEDGQQARRIMRRLVLLGHLAPTDDGVRWTMQPPTLTPLALEPDRVILRGQRTPPLLACLPDNREHTSQVGGPDRICCCAPFADGVSRVPVSGTYFHIEHGILVRAQELPDWRGWMESLRHFDGRDLGKFARTERWDGVYWVGTPLYYDQLGQHVIGPSGMYRLSQETPARSPLTVCFYAERQMILRGDWYGLRFLAGHLSGAHLHAEWDQGGHSLFVPIAERWPFLYEQMLVQASGLLPSRSERPGWLCYPGIPEPLVECLCDKLDIEVEPVVSTIRVVHDHAVT